MKCIISETNISLLLKKTSPLANRNVLIIHFLGISHDVFFLGVDELHNLPALENPILFQLLWLEFTKQKNAKSKIIGFRKVHAKKISPPKIHLQKANIPLRSDSIQLDGIS